MQENILEFCTNENKNNVSNEINEKGYSKTKQNRTYK